MKKIKKFALPSLIALALITLVAWKLNSNKNSIVANAEIAAQKTTVFPVTIVFPNKENMSQSFEANGTFKPLHQLNYLSESSGRVTSVFVKNGQYINKGEVMVQLDNEQISIDLKLANVTLEKAKLDLTKYLSMLENNAVTQQQVEDVKLSLKNAEAKVATLNRQLKISTITAPISGTINNFSIEIGSFLSPGTPIAEIVDIKSLKMSVRLLDRNVLKLSVGQKISISPDLYPTNKLVGEVLSIAPKADDSRKFEVEIEVKNDTKNSLKAGMTGSAIFEFGQEKIAMVLPLKCIVGSLQDPKVFVANDSKALLKPIVIGNIQDDKIEIISGISSKDKVVESGQLNIENGSTIQVIN